MKKQVTEDLRVEIHTFAEASRTVDSELNAMSALNCLQGRGTERELRQQTLASNQTLSEIDEYEAAWVLARPGDTQG